MDEIVSDGSVPETSGALPPTEVAQSGLPNLWEEFDVVLAKLLNLEEMRTQTMVEMKKIRAVAASEEWRRGEMPSTRFRIRKEFVRMVRNYASYTDMERDLFKAFKIFCRT